MFEEQIRWKVRLAELLALVIAVGGILAANSSGPPLQRTGDFGEASCNTFGCHQGNALNASGGSLAISGVPATYQPGSTYPVTVTLERSSQRRWGFECSARSIDTRAQAGNLVVTNSNFTQRATEAGIQFITHSFSGTFPGDAGPKSWTFSWAAPATSAGAIRFSCAGNAANNDGNNSGDFIYTTTATSEGPVTTAPPGLLITMSKSIYVTGDTITATEFRVQNPSNNATPVRLQVWVTAPTIGQITLVDFGGDGSFSLPGNLNSNLGPISLLSVSTGFPPRGTWEFSSRTYAPSNGSILSEDINFFTVQ